MDFIKIKKEIKKNILEIGRYAKKQNTLSDFNFINLLISHSLLSITKKDINESTVKIIDKILLSILNQRNDRLSWNYFNKENKNNSPYPDDLDDTFCSLSLIYKIKPNIINGRKNRSFENILRAAEIKKGGPYNTWIVDKNKQNKNHYWNDTDPSVNANINYFLFLKNTERSKLTKYIDNCVSTHDYKSKYYHSPLFVMYFMSRGYRGQLKQKLIQSILKELKLSKNETHISLGLTALIHLGVASTIIKPFIKKNTFKRPQNLYIERIIKGKIIYATSKLFDLAANTEALILYRNLCEKEKFDREIENFIKRLTLKVHEIIHTLPTAVRPELKKLVSKNIKNNSVKRLMGLPFKIAYYHLPEIDPKSTDKSQLKLRISIALNYAIISLFGWIAYTITDDIVDDTKSINLLPISNLLLRQIHLLLNKTGNAEKKYYLIMDIFDAGIYKSLNKNNYPSVRSTIEKSIGYLMPPVLTLISIEETRKNKINNLEIDKFINFFKEFIFLRQISDDIRDWKEDLLKNNITLITTKISAQKTKILSQSLLQKLLFDMAKSITRARKNINQIGSFYDTYFLDDLLTPYELIIKKLKID